MASAERTALVINFGNQKQFENHETIFDYEYARSACNLFFENAEIFQEEWNKYDHELAEKIYRIAVDKGEADAIPLYTKHRETYQRSADLNRVAGLVSLGASCERLEKEGYFGKQ
jgi:hypothetical protein